MKLNNKGFAITGILYGLLILFVMLVSSYLLILNTKKNMLDKIVEEMERDYFGEEEQQETESQEEDNGPYEINIYKAINNVIDNNPIQTLTINKNEEETVTVEGGHQYRIDSVSCDNNQTATVEEVVIASGQNVNAKFTISNVTSNANCTIYMTP